MDFKEVIDKRHSCRHYLDKKISKKLLQEFVKDDSKAPSGSNSQPWFYSVVNSKPNIDYIKRMIRGYFFNNGTFNYKKESNEFYNIANNFYYNLGNCQAVVFVCYDKKEIDSSIKDNILLSVGASIENFLLSASNQNVGSCWISHFHYYEEELIKTKLIPKNKKLITGFILGYEKDLNFKLKCKKKKINEISTYV